MCLNVIITDMICHQSACSALFSLFVLLIHLLSSNADLHMSPVTKHRPITPESHTTACLFTAPVAVSLMSVLTWSDTLFCQAAAGHQSALWQWHMLLSPYVWNTVHLDTDTAIEHWIIWDWCDSDKVSLLCNSDSGTVQIRHQYLSGSDVKHMFRSDTSICLSSDVKHMFRSDTSICLAVMLSTCSDQTPVSVWQWR